VVGHRLLMWLSGVRVAVKLRPRGAELIYGDLPPSLRSDIHEIARSTRASGLLVLKGRGDRLRVETSSDLDDGVAQRLRNVVHLHRDRL
jgi:hypothetical protein